MIKFSYFSLVIPLLLSACESPRDNERFRSGITDEIASREVVAECKKIDFPTRSASPLSPIDHRLRQRIETLGITLDEYKETCFISPSDPLAQLGKNLFFSKILSGSKDVACASCHHPLLAGGDNLSLSIGVNAVDPDIVGPGRRHNSNSVDDDPEADGLPNIPRNCLSTFNSRFYNKNLFWDGRISLGENQQIKTPEGLGLNAFDPQAQHSLLATQTLFPMTSQQEMRGYYFGSSDPLDTRDAYIQRLNTIPAWQDAFVSVFGEHGIPVTLERLALALEAYQQSQVFIENPWFYYLAGDNDAISESAKMGALLFYDDNSNGGFNCVACHSGSFFTDERFHVLAVPQIGRGKGANKSDLGRFLITKEQKDRYAFRTPTLLNIDFTGPYGHSGAFDKLSDMIEYHLNPELDHFLFNPLTILQFRDTAMNYPAMSSNTSLAKNALLERMVRVNALNTINVEMNPDEKTHLLAFLTSLNDRCLSSAFQGDSESCLLPWLPEVDANPDFILLDARFSDYNENNQAEEVNNFHSDYVVPAPPQYIEYNEKVSVSRCNITPKLNTRHHELSFSDKTESAGLSFSVPLFTAMNKLKHMNQIQTHDALNSLAFVGSVSSGDINKDGYPDLIVATGLNPPITVYINQGNGTFSDETRYYGLHDLNHDRVFSIGLADLDGDTDLDLVLTGRREDPSNRILTSGFMAIYAFDSNKWHRVKQIEPLMEVAYSTSFGDYNNDELLDIAVGTWSAYRKYQPNILWKNRGGLQFSSVGIETKLLKLAAAFDYSFSPVFLDSNDNCFLDLFVVADFNNTAHYFNTHSYQYTDSPEKGIFNSFTDENGMGVAVLDVDNDLDLDLFVSSVFRPIGDHTSMPGTGNRLYINQGQGVYQEIGELANIGDGGWGWGVCAADFNHDGFIDIFHTNGFGLVFNANKHFITSENNFDSYYYDRSRLFLSDGNGAFTEQGRALGINDVGQGRGVTCFDYDKDNDIDIFVNVNSGQPVLYRNNLNSSSKALSIQLRDELSSNTFAIGAKVILEPLGDNNGFSQLRVVNANTNFISQNPTTLHFALPFEGAYQLTIIWPRPYLAQTVLNDIALEGCLVITRDSD